MGNPIERGAGQPKPNLDQMSAQERVEYFRGKDPNFGARVERAFETAVGKLDPTDPVRAEVLEAFQHKVEAHLATPGAAAGGSGLEHLAQMGKQRITEDQYQRLRRSATAVAAEIIKEAGESQYARGAYRELGELVASEWTGADRQG